MSVMNLVQIALFIMAVAIGSAVKTTMGKHVKELDGIRGLVKTKEEGYKGRVEGKFGESH